MGNEAVNIIDNGTGDGGADAPTFTGAQAAFNARHLTWDTDGCDAVSALVMSDQNPFELKVASWHDANKDVLAERRNFDGCVIDQLDHALAYVESLPQLTPASAAAQNDDDRVDAMPVPARAIAEALANALAHRDYEVYSGPTLVNVTPAAVEVISLGGLVGGLRINDLLNGINQPRNPGLTGLLERAGVMRNLGNGIQRIMREYDNAVEAPQLRVGPTSVAVILPLLITERPDIPGDPARSGRGDGRGDDATGMPGAAGNGDRIATKYRFPGMPQGRLTHRMVDGEVVDQIELGIRHEPPAIIGAPLKPTGGQPIDDPHAQPEIRRVDRSELEQQTLALLISRGMPLRRIEIQTALHVSKNQTNYVLRRLTASGKVLRTGHSRSTKYEAALQ